MTSVKNYLPYVLTGCIFYGFGLKWCYEYAKMWMWRPREEPENAKGMGFIDKCKRLLTNHPIEGSLKLVATAVGLTGTLAAGLPDYTAVSPKVVHATIYLFFAFSGLVDVLNFYFPRHVSNGLAKLALAQSFFVEGFLFVWTSAADGVIVNVLLSGIVWTTAFAVVLELVWPEVLLLRGCTTLLHGGWIAHMVRVYRTELLPPQMVALTFTWHVAVASAVTLCIVAVARSCTPRIICDRPPEVPVYDYCQDTEQRV